MMLQKSIPLERPLVKKLEKPFRTELEKIGRPLHFSIPKTRPSFLCDTVTVVSSGEVSPAKKSHRISSLLPPLQELVAALVSSLFGVNHSSPFMLPRLAVNIILKNRKAHLVHLCFGFPSHFETSKSAS